MGGGSEPKGEEKIYDNEEGNTAQRDFGNERRIDEFPENSENKKHMDRASKNSNSIDFAAYLNSGGKKKTIMNIATAI